MKRRDEHRLGLRVCALLCAAAALVPTGAMAQASKAPGAAAGRWTGMTIVATNIVTTSLQPMLDFYLNGLGLKEERRIKHPDILEVHLAFPGGGGNIMLVIPTDAAAVAPKPQPRPLMLIYVPRLAELKQRLIAAGYKREIAIKDINLGRPVRVAVVQDPDGHSLELIELP